MARSKHRTRRDLREELRWNYARAEARSERLKEIRKELREKRTIKRLVSAERRQGGGAGGGPTPVTAIPIRIEDAGPFVNYPATAEELREVLRRLPPGTADGIEAIELTLGRDRQRDYVLEEGYGLDEVDPHVGRHGALDLPGIYCGPVLGEYRSPPGRVQLYAYVYDPGIINLRIKEIYLKLRFLSTFVHEIAHHQDRTRRLRRGRWRFDSPEKAEIYAERVQHDWVQEVVLPYLREAHRARVDELEDWIERQAGVRIPFEKLSGDPRVTAKGGLFRLLFPISGCFEDLLEDVEAGHDLRTIRRNLAVNLHYGDHFDLAMEILETVLREDPEDLRSLAVKADLLHHLQRNGEAEAIVDKVLARDPTLLNAWEVKAHIAWDQRNWPVLLDATTSVLRLQEGREHWILSKQARALLELQEFDRLREVIEELRAHPSSVAKARAFGFEALALLRKGALEEALSVAREGLGIARGTVHVHELLAVRFEALWRIGRLHEATPLEGDTFRWLERRGFEDWVASLKAINPPRQR